MLNESWKNVMMRAFGELNSIFQDEFNKILSQQLTQDRSYMSHYHNVQRISDSHNRIQQIRLKNKDPKHTHLVL